MHNYSWLPLTNVLRVYKFIYSQLANPKIDFENRLCGSLPGQTDHRKTVTISVAQIQLKFTKPPNEYNNDS